MNAQHKELKQKLAQSKIDLKRAIANTSKAGLDRILANHKVPYMEGKGIKINKKNL